MDVALPPRVRGFGFEGITASEKRPAGCVREYAAGRRQFTLLTCSGTTVRADYTAAVPTILLRAAVRILKCPRWIPTTPRAPSGVSSAASTSLEARLIPHAHYLAVVILVDGRARAANEFAHQTDALRWADEQRVINADAATASADDLI